MKTFHGFSPGPSRPVALPEAFFTDLLPLIDDLGELQVTLACFRIVMRKAGSPRAVRWADLIADDSLAAMLDEAGLRAGLEYAVTRGTLLHAWADLGDGPEELYFINTERGREAVRTLERGERPEGLAPAEPPAAEAERPNIFRLYEQHIGLLTPMLADELREAETTARWHGLKMPSDKPFGKCAQLSLYPQDFGAAKRSENVERVDKLLKTDASTLKANMPTTSNTARLPRPASARFAAAQAGSLTMCRSGIPTLARRSAVRASWMTCNRVSLTGSAG
jgi:hypothetical protein